MKELCCLCESHTGRAGKGEDSIYIETNNGEVGPLCETCHSSIQEAIESRCKELAEGQKPTANTGSLKLPTVEEVSSELGFEGMNTVDGSMRKVIERTLLIVGRQLQASA